MKYIYMKRISTKASYTNSNYQEFKKCASVWAGNWLDTLGQPTTILSKAWYITDDGGDTLAYREEV